MSSLPTRTAKSLRSNADPSGTFGTSFASPKRRENEPFSLTKMQANASIFYPFLPRLRCHNKYRLTKADSTNRVPSFPIKLQQTNHHRKQKTASKFSLLLLHFSCVLHFDLLFCKSDFETHQLYEQSH